MSRSTLFGFSSDMHHQSDERGGMRWFTISTASRLFWTTHVEKEQDLHYITTMWISSNWLFPSEHCSFSSIYHPFIKLFTQYSSDYVEPSRFPEIVIERQFPNPIQNTIFDGYKSLWDIKKNQQNHSLSVNPQRSSIKLTKEIPWTEIDVI